MTTSGAEAALRGYRLQALYSLHRILDGGDQFVFHLEGLEDLDVYSTSGELLEVIQVKAIDGNLTLTALSPGKPNAFFRRVLDRRGPLRDTKEKLVSFGPIGPDMSQTWAGDGPKREEAVRILGQYGYTRRNVLDLIKRIELVTVNEREVEQAVFARLRECATGIDPQSAFELLHAWMFTKAEAKARITHKDVIERINQVGRFLAEVDSFRRNWFSTIVPLDDVQKADAATLTDEFYRGIGARYEHIIAGVDIERKERLDEIKKAFDAERIVIVRGNSGQGKSALAYRYLHEHVLDRWRYEIRVVQDQKHAHDIALAIRGQLNAFDMPVHVYVDVRPGNTSWLELVQELARLPLARVLVTIREEDWRRTSVFGDVFDFREVELRFDEVEARGIYDRLVERRQPAHVLGFDDAWSRFGKTGPLLEFAYFLVQNKSLRDRLLQQVIALRDEVRERRLGTEELEFLRCASVASAYGARLDMVALARELRLPEPSRTVERFEREYFLRIGGDGRHVEALHPIRSTILAELLTQNVFNPWSEAAAIAVRTMVEEDLEFFLLHAFSRRRAEIRPLLEVLAAFEPHTWTGMAGILRSMLWLSVREYVDQNEALIRETHDKFGSGWYMALMPDIANLEAITPGMMESPIETLDIMPDEAKRLSAGFRDRLTPPSEALDQVREWLSSRRRPSNAPKDESDWRGAAEVLFWAAHLGLPIALSLRPLPAEIHAATSNASMEAVADLAYALSFLRDDQTVTLLDAIRPPLLERFQREMLTPAVDDDGVTVRAHFIVDPDYIAGTKSAPTEGAAKSFLHHETMARVWLLQRIFPSRSVFASQGYGHHRLGFELPHDDTMTNVLARYCPPTWLVGINSWVHRLGEYMFRPRTWHEYTRSVVQIRRASVDNVEAIIAALNKYFRGNGQVIIDGKLIDEVQWSTNVAAIRNRAQLPRDAVDEWGFFSESMQKNGQLSAVQKPLESVAVIVQQHQVFLDTSRDCWSALEAFYSQVPKAGLLGLRRTKNAGMLERIQEFIDEGKLDADPGHLPTVNLSNAVKALPAFQREFRKRFSVFAQENELASLDVREHERVLRAFCLWYQFVHHTEREGMDQPSQFAAEQFEQAHTMVRRKLHEKLKTLKSAGIRTTMRTLNASSDEQPGLYILFDIEDAGHVYEGMGQVYVAVLDALPHGDDLRLPHYAVLFTWPSIYLIPLVRGRSLSRTGWRFSVSWLLRNPPIPQEKPLLFQMAPISDSARTALEIIIWEHPRLEIMRDIYSATRQLAALTGHVAGVNEIPEPNGIGDEVLRAYAEKQSRRMGDAHQDLMRALNRFVDYAKRCADQLVARPNLAKTIELVSSVVDMIASGHDDGTISLGINEVCEWAEQIRLAFPSLDTASLYWANDVLDEIAAENGN